MTHRKRKRNASYVGAVLLGFCFLFSSAVVAEPENDVEQQRNTLYREAQGLADQGRWTEASKKLEQVVALRSAPKALMALAYVEFQQGHLLAAMQLYERALTDARQGRLDEDVRAAQKGLSELEALMPRVTLVLPTEVTSFSVTVDGAAAMIREEQVLIDPGQHTLVVTASGRRPFETTFVVEPGSRLEISVVFPQQVGDEGAWAASNAESSGRFPVGPSVLGIVGLAATSAGAVFWGRGTAGYNRLVDSECGGDASRCPEERREAITTRANSHRRDILLGQLSVGAGILTLAGAGMWWLTSREPARETAAGLRISAGPAPLGASLAGQF